VIYPARAKTVAAWRLEKCLIFFASDEIFVHSRASKVVDTRAQLPPGLVTVHAGFSGGFRPLRTIFDNLVAFALETAEGGHQPRLILVRATAEFEEARCSERLCSVSSCRVKSCAARPGQ
jgi:hypothetical protein